MKQTPEGKVLAAIVKHLRKKQLSGEPLFFARISGSPLQRRGLPDLHITYYGQSIWVEVKAPGKKPTALQQQTLALIEAAEGIAVVADTLMDVVALLDSLAEVDDEDYDDDDFEPLSDTDDGVERLYGERAE